MSKFRALSDQIENLDTRLKRVSELNSDFDTQIEEFKDQMGIKHKLLLDNLSNLSETIKVIDGKNAD